MGILCIPAELALAGLRAAGFEYLKVGSIEAIARI